MFVEFLLLELENTMWQVSVGKFYITINSGVLIPLLLLAPNFLWIAFPGSENLQEQVDEPVWLTIIENVGRLGVFLIPAFFTLDPDRNFSIPVLIMMGLSLILYYTAWGRYFAGGRAIALLKAPLLGIPLPMAVFPVVFLILSSYLMDSWLMFAASLFFGVVHLWVSAIGT